MSEPKRIQRQRTKGWKMPEGAIYVGRPSRWGNPYRVGAAVVQPTNDYTPTANPHCEYLAPARSSMPCEVERWSARGEYRQTWFVIEDAATAVRLFRELCEYEGYDMSRLRGHDLACWCPLDQPCHADVLLELANAVAPKGGAS